MSSMKIAQVSDPELLKVCARFMADSEPWLTLGIDYKRCLKSTQGPLKEVYLASLDSKPLGFIILQMHGTFKGYIQTVCVGPDARGMGVGTAIVKFAEKRITKDSKNCFLCVSAFNKGAQKLYKRLGYTKVGILKDFIVKGQDEILMRKILLRPE